MGPSSIERPLELLIVGIGLCFCGATSQSVAGLCSCSDLVMCGKIVMGCEVPGSSQQIYFWQALLWQTGLEEVGTLAQLCTSLIEMHAYGTCVPPQAMKHCLRYLKASWVAAWRLTLPIMHWLHQ